MQRSVLALSVFAIAFFGVCSAMADTSRTHDVTVCVSPFSAISVEPGDIALTLDGSGALSRESTATATWQLRWMTNQEDQKITVATNLVSPCFLLRVEAFHVTGGTASGEVLLQATPQDLIIGLSRGMGGCEVRYTSPAAGLLPPDRDSHVITYTITGGD